MEQNRTAWVVLGLLAIENNKSGYDLRKAIESSVGHFWGESYGQLYPTLKRLAAEGLIVPSSSANGSRKRRQEYSITDAGRAALRDWLALPFQNDPPRNEFLLKLFFGREAAPEVTLGHIRELQERNRRSLAQMLEIRSLAPKLNAGNPHLPYWMLTVDLGIAMTKAALDWGESALSVLAHPEPDAVREPYVHDGLTHAR
jgi:DNA-binding PadR family transcriptional regulator